MTTFEGAKAMVRRKAQSFCIIESPCCVNDTALTSAEEIAIANAIIDNKSSKVINNGEGE